MRKQKRVLPEFTENTFWVRDEDELDSSDQVQILAQLEQYGAVIPLSKQHMIKVRKGMIKTENLNSLLILDRDTMPVNEPVASQPRTYASQKGQQVGNFQDRVQSKQSAPKIVSRVIVPTLPSKSTSKFDVAQELLKVKIPVPLVDLAKIPKQISVII
jgi:hypothetical protein